MNDPIDKRDPLKSLEELAARAREEEAPRVDAAPGVLHRLWQREDSLVRPLAIFALGSSAVAIAALGFIGYLLYTIKDPLRTLFQLMPMVVP